MQVVDQRPHGVCGCGTDLTQAADQGVASACQVTDVPLVTASTVEHRRYRVRCGCGREHVAMPPGQPGWVAPGCTGRTCARWPYIC